VIVPVALERGPGEQASGSTGHVFRGAFAQVRSRCAAISYPRGDAPGQTLFARSSRVT
jgi:hypothetical protein